MSIKENLLEKETYSLTSGMKDLTFVNTVTSTSVTNLKHSTSHISNLNLLTPNLDYPKTIYNCYATNATITSTLDK
jgi:hypothetical protein